MKHIALGFVILTLLFALFLPGKIQEDRKRYESCLNKGGLWVTLQDRTYVCARLEIIQS